jgi:hypothetical protein
VNTAAAPGPDAPATLTDPVPPAGEGPSLPHSLVRLLEDLLELLALEGRAAALTLAWLVCASVAAGCFAMFAWFGLSAIGVVALVRAGHSPLLALVALAAVNGGLALCAVLLVRRLTRSIVLGEGVTLRFAGTGSGDA